MTNALIATNKDCSNSDSQHALVGAAGILRGVQRLLAAYGLESIAEMALANGRRADAFALAASGEIWIVEIKSSIADFRSDQKWHEYREYCDALLFAVAPDFPVDILPPEAGLILADAYGAEIIRAAPEHRLPAARRKALVAQVATTAARRLQALLDPDFVNPI